MLSGVFAVVVAIVLVGAIVSIASSDDTVDAPSDQKSYPVGQTGELADRIAKDGPVAFPSVLGPDRPIWIQHLGTSDDKGWLVISAVVPGTDCTVQWKQDEGRFEDCEGRTYPPDGGDLPRYQTQIRDGRLFVERPSSDSGGS